jgi:hypothetical protein
MILGIDVGQKNLGVCVVDAAAKVIAKWAVWESTGTWARDVAPVLARAATDDFLEGVSHVVIEHQPSKNPSMVRIMHYLEFFFVSRGLPVCLQDSKHKLLFASTTPWFPKDCTDREWTYRQRKKLAVETAATFVRDTAQPLAAVFENSKKKDDLADALLHAMAFGAFGVLGGGIGAASRVPDPAKPKKVVARAPTERQLKTGRLSASNVKHMLRETPAAGVPAALKNNSQLARALKKHFGGVQAFVAQCKPQ